VVDPLHSCNRTSVLHGDGEDLRKGGTSRLGPNHAADLITRWVERFDHKVAIAGANFTRDSHSVVGASLRSATLHITFMGKTLLRKGRARAPGHLPTSPMLSLPNLPNLP